MEESSLVVLPGPLSAGRVDEELVVDGVADASLQRAHRFFVAVALGAFAEVVVTSGGVVADLGDGGEMDRMVELAVAAVVEPVARSRPRRRVQRRGRVVAGVMGFGREPADVAGMTDEMRGNDRADTMDLGDRRVRGAHRGDDAGAQCRELAVRVADFAEELVGALAACDPDRVVGSDPAQLPGRPISRESAGSPPAVIVANNGCSRQID